MCNSFALAGGATSSVLLEVSLQIRDNSDCGNLVSSTISSVTDNMLCASGYSNVNTGGRDTCQVCLEETCEKNLVPHLIKLIAGSVLPLVCHLSYTV